MSEESIKVKPKAKIERNLKTCVVEFVGKRYARNPESFKPEYAFFHLTGTFSIEPNKRFESWTLTKIIRPYRFTWMSEPSVKTVIGLCDGEQTIILNPCGEMQYGVNLEFSEAKRITAKEAQTLISQGAKVVELDPNSDGIAKGDGLPFARFSKR